METSTIVGALLIIAVLALVILTYTGRIELSAELPFIKFMVKGESENVSGAEEGGAGRTGHRSDQSQVDAETSTQEMPASSGGKQSQRRTRGSSQKMT